MSRVLRYFILQTFSCFYFIYRFSWLRISFNLETKSITRCNEVDVAALVAYRAN